MIKLLVGPRSKILGVGAGRRGGGGWGAASGTQRLADLKQNKGPSSKSGLLFHRTVIVKV